MIKATQEGPSVLLCGRPLTFGDAEQIRVLKEMRRNIEEEDAEEREKKREAGVKIPFDVYLKVRVEAIDEEEAEWVVRRGIISLNIEVDRVEEP